MRYGNSTNIDQNLNYLFDKELVLEITTEEENNKTTYKLYQIVDEKDSKDQIIKKKLEIPLSSNVIEYLNTNKENFIKGSKSDFDAKQNVFTIGTSTTFEEKEKENQFIITSYFHIDPETLDVIDNTGNKILSLKNISPSSNTVIDQTTTTKLNANNYNVGIDKYGRIVSMEKRENGPQSLDEATNFSAIKMQVRKMEIKPQIYIGPYPICSKKDYNFGTIYIIPLETEADLTKLEEVKIQSCWVNENSNYTNAYNVNSYGFIYFDTNKLNINITKKIKISDKYSTPNPSNIKYITPDGLYQYFYINQQLFVIKIDIDKDKNNFYYTNKKEFEKKNILSLNNETYDTLYLSQISENNPEITKINLASNKANFAIKNIITASSTSENYPDISTSIGLEYNSLFNLQLNYSILIRYIKDGNCLNTSSQIGQMLFAIDTCNIQEDSNDNILGIKTDIFKSNNFIGENIPILSLTKEKLKYCILKISFKDENILDEKGNWDQIEIIFSGNINGLNETRF